MKRLLTYVLFLTLLIGCACAQEVLEYGSQGDRVTAIQERLSELGYYKGKVSGNFLEGTRVAVKRFQKDYKLEVTGTVDEATEDMLMNAEYRVLKEDMDGEDVTRLQQQLKELGFFNREPTGKYRSITAEAVRAFQKKAGLEATGIADLETQRLLFSDDPSSQLGDVEDMVIAGDGEKMVEYTQRLDRGAKGANVKKVQERLKELGFFDGPVSGNYMNQTMAAVEAFQLHNGLYVDGVTGQDTWDMLFNDETVVDALSTPKPTPVPTPIPYAITVDVNNQVTIVYGRDDNGEYTIPVKQMVCSTGLKATPSTVGEFTLTGRRARWCYFPTWGSHAQYWTKINDYIAFHSVIYNEVDYDALNTKSYKKLGQRASHGCIRLLVSDAQWIYENIGEGVVVTVTEDLPSDEELRKAVAAPPLNSAKNGPVTTPEPTPLPDYTSDSLPSTELRKLSRGTEGEDVYWLQMKLKELGYYTGTVTGGYYAGTIKAVRAYQKDHGLTQSDSASVAMQEHLYADLLATPTPEPTPEPTLSPAPTPKPEA